jgi:hypothetical protein
MLRVIIYSKIISKRHCGVFSLLDRAYHPLKVHGWELKLTSQQGDFCFDQRKRGVRSFAADGAHGTRMETVVDEELPRSRLAVLLSISRRSHLDFHATVRAIHFGIPCALVADVVNRLDPLLFGSWSVPCLTSKSHCIHSTKFFIIRIRPVMFPRRHIPVKNAT